jgi:ascorbate-specific PTS system EIIC-type component UlaA
VTTALVEKIRREPALLVAFVTAVLIALTEFGVDMTTGQQAAIVGVVIAIGSIIVRQSVTPNVNVGALTDDAPGNTNGDLMAGQASSVPDGDPVDVVPVDEVGAYDTGNLLVALACLVIIVVGLVWLVRQF